ncbi:uncharacterized protein LOC132707622 isoform X2 [Cylas formicarius]|uniref:uncharacterized protein LOC132707622 isoform X2 n=1 Tax=Cylas formicarius TaxID=197179 RepID=UPI002958374F|nr:uncharacterized protein LOC132707622 isoform X2 [Cylas formicarius]
MKGTGLFDITRTLMIISGAWRSGLPKVSKLLNVFYVGYSAVIQFSYFLYFLCYAVNFYFLYFEDFDKAIENLSGNTFVLLLVAKVLLCQKNRLISTLKQAHREELDVYREEDRSVREIYEHHLKYFYKLIFTIASYNGIVLLKLYIVGIGGSYQFRKIHRHDNVTLEKPLPLPLWYPFDHNRFHVVALTFQLVALVWSALFNTMVYAVSNSLAIFLRGKIKIFQYRLRNFDRCNLYVNRDDSGSLLEVCLFKKLCREHQMLIRMTRCLNASFRSLFLLEYSLTSLLMGAVLVQIHKSLELVPALYESNWCERSNQVKTMIKFMMLKCQRPLVLSVGPFGPLTMDDAVSRLKLAYSFLSIMSGRS